MLGVRLCGELSVEIDGRALEVIKSGRARALLGWLALHPGLHPRSRVASRFWPDVLEQSARANLRTTLTTLRRELGSQAADCIMASRERIGIEGRPGLSIDVREFDRLVAEGSAEQALALYRGELLTDLDDDWVLEERQLHRDRVAAVLGALGAACEEAGDNRRAVAYAREQLALDPLSEGTARVLIARLARAGDRASAIAVSLALRESLRRELGVAPPPETRALVEEIRNELPSPATMRAPPAVPPMLTRSGRRPVGGSRRRARPATGSVATRHHRRACGRDDRG